MPRLRGAANDCDGGREPAWGDRCCIAGSDRDGLSSAAYQGLFSRCPLCRSLFCCFGICAGFIDLVVTFSWRPPFAVSLADLLTSLLFWPMPPLPRVGGAPRRSSSIRLQLLLASGKESNVSYDECRRQNQDRRPAFPVPAAEKCG